MIVQQAAVLHVAEILVHAALVLQVVIVDQSIL